MNNKPTDNKVSFETVVWWWSIAVVAGFIIAAVVMTGFV